MDVESVPQVSQYHNAAESQVFYQGDIFRGDSPKCHDFLVDDTFRGRFLEGIYLEGRSVVGLGDAVEDGTEKNVVEVFLFGFQVVHVVERFAEMSLIPEGGGRIPAVQMYTSETEFFLQVEVVMYDDLIEMAFRQ